MTLKQYSGISIAVLAVAGLLFAGCSKKEVVGGSTPVSIAPAQSGATIKPSTSSVSSQVQAPSSHTVYFAFDSSALDAAAHGILDANATWLTAHHDSTITIEGNCDERGAREYNLALGQRRADSVRDYLVAGGVSASRIETVSFGEERPVCQGTGEACWAQNRHADIVVH